MPIATGIPASHPIIRPNAQTSKCVEIPAPMSGINALDPLVSMQPSDSVFQYNLIPSQYGTKVRTGYTNWATSVGTGGVNTVLPYNGTIPANDRLFVAGRNGIFDVSSSGAVNPAAAITFGTITASSGFGNGVAFATLAGHYLAYADEANGYYTYTEGTGWLKVTLGGGGTQVSGFDPSTFVQACSFKQRLWFVLRDSATAVYLPTGAVYGAATQFNFGDKFRHGGFLVGLYNWTLDGGNGIDDYLVAVGSAGDVIIYQGTDPSVATSFSIVGQWYIGPPPSGRRIAGSFGGDLYLLSSYGLLPLSKLIAGILIDDQAAYLSRKISPLVNQQMSQARTQTGWEVKLVPSENLLLVSVPQQGSNPFIQFAQSLNTQGWAIYRDIPYLTGDAWNGQFYIGTADGRVLFHTGSVDTTLAGVSTAINWSALSSYQEYGETGRFHRVQFIRPVFLSASIPSFEVEARYDYDLSEVLQPPVAGGATAGSQWDVSKWDQALWSGGSVSESFVRGGNGLGRAMAIGINGSSTQATTLVRYDNIGDTGGYL
jgi:hypothetical protein